MFSPLTLCSLRLLELETEGQTEYKQNTSPKSYKTEIKLLANPDGLAFEQLSEQLLETKAFRQKIIRVGSLPWQSLGFGWYLETVENCQ